MPAGIGEHSDITEAVIEELEQTCFCTRQIGYD